MPKKILKSFLGKKGVGSNSEAEKFIDCLCRTLGRGFNTDTTCSIVMGLVGARVGHNQIPTYFRKTIFNSVPEAKPARSK